MVPPWWNTIPINQAKKRADRSPRTMVRPADSANARAPPVRVHRPMSPPSAQRYTIRIIAYDALPIAGIMNVWIRLN